MSEIRIFWGGVWRRVGTPCDNLSIIISFFTIETAASLLLKLVNKQGEESMALSSEQDRAIFGRSPFRKLNPHWISQH